MNDQPHRPESRSPPTSFSNVGLILLLPKRYLRVGSTVGDYLLASPSDRKADLVVGNPPYIRYDDLPEGAFAAYSHKYPTMIGRCDIYVGFIEAGVNELNDGGSLAFICADRWMRAAYGAELRRLVSRQFSMDFVVEMHEAQAFENDVAAYPAIIVIRRAAQGAAVVASASSEAGPLSTGGNLGDALVNLAAKRVGKVDKVPASPQQVLSDGSAVPDRGHGSNLLSLRFFGASREVFAFRLKTHYWNQSRHRCRHWQRRVYVTTDPK